LRPWQQIGEATNPGSNRSLLLYRGKDDFYISLSGTGGDLMNTRQHSSEDALGALPCQRLANATSARVLVGGLGMGFTLAAALAEVGPDAEVTVAELIPEVVDWNRGELGAFSGNPLNDPRTRVHVGDVKDVLRKSRRCWDVITLDVDNGPEGLTKNANDWLYSPAGIDAAQNALAPGGVLAYWSAGPDAGFADRLRLTGMLVEEIPIRAHAGKGPRYLIWLAQA
jgi:spermidine synthase